MRASDREFQRGQFPVFVPTIICGNLRIVPVVYDFVVADSPYLLQRLADVCLYRRGPLLPPAPLASGGTSRSCHTIQSLSMPLCDLMRPCRCPYPVSYTHLRAHETPEHLVCRLLLEKKKKKKKK